MDAMNTGLTIVTIVALAITVFQTDEEPSGRRDSDENAGRICLSYVFGVFPIIPIPVLGYLVAYAFRNDSIVMYFCFILTFFCVDEMRCRNDGGIRRLPKHKRLMI